MSDRRVACKLDQTAKPYPYNAEQLAWLHDLETTTESQVQGSLHVMDAATEKNVGFCCLGRACVISGIPSFICNEHSNQYTLVYYETCQASLPPSLVGALRLRDGLGRLAEPAEIKDEVYEKLAEMNDRGLSFKEIAAYIRANPWNVFKAPEKNT